MPVVTCGTTCKAECDTCKHYVAHTNNGKDTGSGYCGKIRAQTYSDGSCEQFHCSVVEGRKPL